jgi:hypothetical protein
MPRCPDKALPDLEKALTMPENKRIGVTTVLWRRHNLIPTKQKKPSKTSISLLDQYGSQNPEHFYNRGVTHHKLGHLRRYY